MSVVCRILANDSSSHTRQNAAVILELTRNNGAPSRIVVPRTLDVVMNFGDRIKSISGTAAVLINPGTKAGAFTLSPKLPPNANWNHRTELEINEETTKVICRGEIFVTNDIGTVLRATSGTTR